MAVPNIGNPSGFNIVQLYTKNSSGLATGQAGTSPSNGTTSHSYVSTLISTANFSPRAVTTVEFEGGNTIVGQVSFGGSGLQPFDVVADAEDAAMMALVNGSNVDGTTVSGWNIYSSNPRRVVLPDMGMIITNQFQSRVAASKGQTFYRNVIVPAAQVRASIGGATYQGKVQMTLNVTPTFASKFPNGIAFSSTQNWQENETDHYVIITENPLFLTTFISDASATTFTTAYRPVSTVVTVSTRPNWFSRNSTAAALSSIVTSTGVATMSSAGTAGDVNILLYESTGTAV